MCKLLLRLLSGFKTRVWPLVSNISVAGSSVCASIPFKMKLILFVFSLFVVVIGYRGIAEALDNHSSKQLTWRVVFVYPMDRPLVSHPVSLHSGELPFKNSFKPSFKPVRFAGFGYFSLHCFQVNNYTIILLNT